MSSWPKRELCSLRALVRTKTTRSKVQSPLEYQPCQLAFSKQSFSRGHIMAQTFTRLKGPKPFFFCSRPKKFALCPAFEASSLCPFVGTVIVALFGQTFHVSPFEKALWKNLWQHHRLKKPSWRSGGTWFSTKANIFSSIPLSKKKICVSSCRILQLRVKS